MEKKKIEVVSLFRRNEIEDNKLEGSNAKRKQQARKSKQKEERNRA